MNSVALANGVQMPLLGLGVFQVRSGRETESAVRWALEAGYRHVDTAKLYGNEESVGRALAASGVPRDELFVTTKLLPRARDAGAEAGRPTAAGRGEPARRRGRLSTPSPSANPVGV